MNTSQLINQIADDIEKLLNDHPMAAANPDIPRRLRFLASRLSDVDRYASNKAYEIAQCADEYYSARKHPGGGEALWSKMTFDLLNRIRSQAESRKRYDAHD